MQQIDIDNLQKDLVNLVNENQRLTKRIRELEAENELLKTPKTCKTCMYENYYADEYPCNKCLLDDKWEPLPPAPGNIAG